MDNNQPAPNTINSLQANPGAPNPGKKSGGVVKKVLTVIGGIVAGLVVLGVIVALFAKPIELTGSEQFQNRTGDPEFTIDLPAQFSESDYVNSGANTLYSYTTEEDSEGRSEVLAGVLMEDLGALAPLFAGLDDDLTIEEYLYDLYLNDETGKEALEGVIDLSLDLDKVSINEIKESSATNVDRMLEFAFTAENDEGTTDVEGMYWFALGNNDQTGYNVVVAASDSAWEQNEAALTGIIDSFTPAQ